MCSRGIPVIAATSLTRSTGTAFHFAVPAREIVLPTPPLAQTAGGPARLDRCGSTRGRGPRRWFWGCRNRASSCSCSPLYRKPRVDTRADRCQVRSARAESGSQYRRITMSFCYDVMTKAWETLRQQLPADVRDGAVAVHLAGCCSANHRISQSRSMAGRLEKLSEGAVTEPTALASKDVGSRSHDMARTPSSPWPWRASAFNDGSDEQDANSYAAGLPQNCS
jgi:hypothetical protein